MLITSLFWFVFVLVKAFLPAYFKNNWFLEGEMTLVFYNKRKDLVHNNRSTAKKVDAFYIGQKHICSKSFYFAR